jgi:hypothetical protein
MLIVFDTVDEAKMAEQMYKMELKDNEHLVVKRDGTIISFIKRGKDWFKAYMSAIVNC